MSAEFILVCVGAAALAGVASWCVLMLRVRTLRARIDAADRESSVGTIEAAERLRRLAIAANSLRQAHAMLEEVALHSPVGLIACDTERILWANRAAAAETGVSIGDMTSRTFAELVHPDDLADGVAVVEENADGGLNLLRYRNRWVQPSTGQVVSLVWRISPYTNGRAYCTVQRADV